MNEAFEKILEKLEEYEYENLVEHDSKFTYGISCIKERD